MSKNNTRYAVRVLGKVKEARGTLLSLSVKPTSCHLVYRCARFFVSPYQILLRCCQWIAYPEAAWSGKQIQQNRSETVNSPRIEIRTYALKGTRTRGHMHPEAHAIRSTCTQGHMHLLQSSPCILYIVFHRVRIDGGWGVNPPPPPQFPCSFHFGPQPLSSCSVADPPSSFFTIRTMVYPRSTGLCIATILLLTKKFVWKHTVDDAPPSLGRDVFNEDIMHLT